MQTRTPLLIATILLTACATQSMAPHSFPAGATTPSAAELQQRLVDKNYSIRYASGGSAHIQFKNDGRFSFDASNNVSNAGTWRTEDGKICTNVENAAETCYPARISGDTVHVQRANGEIVRYDPR